MDGCRPIFRNRGSRGKLRPRYQLPSAPKERVDEPTLARRRKRHPRTLASHHLGLTPGEAWRRCASVVFVCVSLVLAGCNQRAIESWLSQTDANDPTPSLYGDTTFAKLLTEVKKRVPSPVKALSFLVYPDHAVLQAQ